MPPASATVARSTARRRRRAAQSRHDRAVELQELHRQAHHVEQAGQAAAEVVQRQPHAEPAQPPQRARDRVQVAHRQVFRHLDLEPPRRHAAGAQRAGDAVREGRVAQGRG
jgi:hypothetical protein